MTELDVPPWGAWVIEACRDPLRHSWWSHKVCDPDANWADLAPTLIRWVDAALGLARVGSDLPQGLTSTVVHWAAHANVALRTELRGADLPIGRAPDAPEPSDE